MKLKKCPVCNNYTLRETCKKCGKKTKESHYKFINIKDAPKSDISIVRRK
jgi:recombinational DNA repair protein RecR